jgi:hypothetical protein
LPIQSQLVPPLHPAGAPSDTRSAQPWLRLLGWLAASTLLLASLALPASPAQAQGNDLSAPSGGRSTLMGNTGVALARDGSAPFYNPATIVRILDERLAFSVNFYTLEIAHYSSWHQPLPIDNEYFGDQDLEDTALTDSSFRSLPDSLCLFFTLEDLASLATLEFGDREEATGPRKKLAVCFATLESDDIDMQAIGYRGMTAAGLTTQAQSLQRRWNRTYIGPTYSQVLSRALAIGASLQVVYTYGSFGLNSSSLSLANDGSSIASTLGASGSGKSFELTALLGATYRIGRTTLGVSVRTPSLHLLGDYEGTVNRSDSTAIDGTIIAEGSGSMQAPPPTRLALGAGFTWPRLTLEFDLAFGFPLQDAMDTSLDVRTYTAGADGIDQQRTQERRMVEGVVTVNPSVGIEYFVNPGISALAGLTANFSSIAPLVLTGSAGDLIQARTNHVSMSLGIGSYWRGGELLFGMQLDYAWGQAAAIDPYSLPNSWGLVDRQAYRLMFVMSGATSLNAIVGAVKKIATSGDQPDNGEKPATPQSSEPAPPAPHDGKPSEAAAGADADSANR